MKTIVGLDAARKALCDGRGLDLASVPPGVAERTREAFGQPLTPVEVVDLIVTQVRQRGDEAVREMSAKLDGTDLAEIEVPAEAISSAYDQVPGPVVEALSLAAQRVRQFHEAARVRSWMDFDLGYGEIVNPVRRVGVYVPGGTARYPSTVLMAAIPAKVAGVAEVIVCTPSRRNEGPHPVVLAAADIAGVDRVFQIGGAQAIASMAYGTETVPRVDIVCGPGNVFVTLAKKMVFGDVGVDGLYGPTETLIIADETANPTLCAADLLAQAEHDILATPVLITTSEELAGAVDREAKTRMERLERGHIAREAMEQRGCIAVVEDLDEALELANQFAPEHMCLMVREPWSHLGKVRNAGAVFMGEFSHEVLGDYVAGPSHVMPTSGTARFSSGLGIHSFVKTSPVVALDDSVSSELGKVASIIARAEGFTAHAEAAEVRDELL